MSNRPSQPGDFGSQQFQKLQFGHNPNAISKGEEAEKFIASKLAMPASIMVILGTLTLVAVVLTTAISAMTFAANKDQIVDEMKREARARITGEARGTSFKLNQQQQDELARVSKGHQNMMAVYMGLIVCSGVILATLATFYIVAGQRMKHLRGYNQAYFASVMALIPVCSPVGVLGIPIGIWLLILLKDKDVKRAFKN